MKRPWLGVGRVSHVKPLPHNRKAPGQVNKPCSHGIAHIQAGEKFPPTDLTGSTHVGRIDVHEFDRLDGNSNAVENKRLQRDEPDLFGLCGE